MISRMRTHIGIGLSTDSIRAVALSRRGVEWACECTTEASEPIERAVGELLARVHISRWPRPRVAVALGPGYARVKRLSGLPRVEDPDLIHGLVRENADRFFPRPDGGAVVMAVSQAGEDSVWALLADEEAVSAISRACRSAGLMIGSFAPSVTTVLAAVTDATSEFQVVDGGITAIVKVENGGLASVRHEAVSSQTMAVAGPPVLADARQALAADAAIYADAFGAVTLGTSAELSFRDDRGPETRLTRISRARRAAAVLALSVGLLAPAVAPIVAPARTLARDRAWLEATEPQVRESQTLYSDMQRFGAALDAAGSFWNSRRSPSLLLAELTRVVPNGVAIISLRVDTLGGSMVLLGDRATSVLTLLEKAAGVTNPRLSGPVTRELIAGEERERVTIRFEARRTIAARNSDSLSHYSGVAQ